MTFICKSCNEHFKEPTREAFEARKDISKAFDGQTYWHTWRSRNQGDGQGACGPVVEEATSVHIGNEDVPLNHA